jgi:hypothetical protein
MRRDPGKRAHNNENEIENNHMSALNVVKQRDRVVLVTDGACWDVNTGLLRGFPTKVATLPALPAVFATRGNPLATPIWGHLLSNRFQSFDAMVAGIEDAIPDIHRQVKLMCRNQGDTDSPIVIAGWSHERQRPEAYVIRLTEDDAGGTLEETAEGPPAVTLQAPCTEQSYDLAIRAARGIRPLRRGGYG